VGLFFSPYGRRFLCAFRFFSCLARSIFLFKFQ
jgi:hypothetical protein